MTPYALLDRLENLSLTEGCFDAFKIQIERDNGMSLLCRLEHLQGGPPVRYISHHDPLTRLASRILLER